MNKDLLNEDMTIEIKDVYPVDVINGLMTGIDALTKLIDTIDDIDFRYTMNCMIEERKALKLMVNDITYKRYGHVEFEEIY